MAKGFAASDEPIVILGETGSGKEVLAQSIHNHSDRAGKAFVAVNCAAIPENLLESELFGYNEGAFTGAKKGGKEGYFEMAHRGTIFLDEISEMNPLLQSKLLRVIQEKQVLRIGGTQLIPFDARVIVATNKNLWELVLNNGFRKDLYYRLNVLELDVPPLREHPADIPLLFRLFWEQLLPGQWLYIAPQFDQIQDLLEYYDWPGNIRELENLVHTIAAFWKAQDNIEDCLQTIKQLLNKKLCRSDKKGFCVVPNDVTIQNNERILIEEVLKECDGNYTEAAKKLGIHRTTLWRKIQKNAAIV